MIERFNEKYILRSKKMLELQLNNKTGQSI